MDNRLNIVRPYCDTINRVDASRLSRAVWGTSKKTLFTAHPITGHCDPAGTRRRHAGCNRGRQPNPSSALGALQTPSQSVESDHYLLRLFSHVSTV